MSIISWSSLHDLGIYNIGEAYIRILNKIWNGFELIFTLTKNRFNKFNNNKNKWFTLKLRNIYIPVALQCKFLKFYETWYKNQITHQIHYLTMPKTGFEVNILLSLTYIMQFKISMTVSNMNWIFGLLWDIIRAFNTVDHYLLITKLHKMEIRGPANEWVYPICSKTDLAAINNIKIMK